VVQSQSDSLKQPKPAPIISENNNSGRDAFGNYKPPAEIEVKDSSLHRSLQMNEKSFLGCLKYPFNVEFTGGIAQIFNDPKSNQYIVNYETANFGLTFYGNNLSYGFTFNPTTLEALKKEIPLNNGAQVGIGNGISFVDLIKFQYVVGYDFFLNEKWCITPIVGVFQVNFQVYEDGTAGTTSGHSDPKYQVAPIYGYKAGFALTRYFGNKTESDASGFVRLNADFNYYNMDDEISSFGNYFGAFTVSIGVRFHATGKQWGEFAGAILSGL